MRARFAALALAAAAAIGGCGTGFGARAHKRVTVDWDLSHSHTPAGVGWPRTPSDTDSTEIRATGPVRIRLPAGHAFAADHGIPRIGIDREGDVLSDVTVFTAPLEIDEAYRLALAWARRYGLARAPLDAWRARVRSERSPVVVSVEFFWPRPRRSIER